MEVRQIIKNLEDSDIAVRWRAARDMQNLFCRSFSNDREAMVLVRAALARLERDVDSPLRERDADNYAGVMENCIYAIGHATSAGFRVSEVKGIIEMLDRLKNDTHEWVREAAIYALEKYEQRKREKAEITGENTEATARESRNGVDGWHTLRLAGIRGNRDTPTGPIKASKVASGR